ncbi:MAG TPA: Hsp20/alpha crystallin family protein [Pyrinomonadaceae bacterium]|jgi:HSP20 family protein
MAKSIERYFRLLHVPQRQPGMGQRWSPAADVYQIKGGWLVKVDLAGVRPDEIEIEITGPILRLSGCRRDAYCQETLAYHQIEITYSRFEKTLRFPCAIEGATVERDYRDGLLILRLRGQEECEESSQ